MDRQQHDSLRPAEDTQPNIWCHVKTEWDRQFVKRANFIPWLRAQLQVDPIDETAPSPEPLLNYVKRRLALAQDQQRLRESANNGPSKTTHSSPDTALAASSVNGIHHRLPTFTTHDSVAGGSTNLAPSASTQQSERACLTNSGNQLYDHGPSNPSSCAANGTRLQGRSPASAMSYSEPSPASTCGTFSSQLGAIADAHMGNSINMAPASSVASNSQVNGFHYAPNDIGASQHYHPSNTSVIQYQQQSPMQFLQDQAASQELQPLSLHQQSSVPLSSYAHHAAQPNPALAFESTHPHPLQPQNVNQYSPAYQSAKVSPYGQFVETHQNLLEQQENPYPRNNEKLDTLPGEPNNWNPAPVVPIDPSLFAGYQTNQPPQTSNDVLPPISAAVDAPQASTILDSNLSPRRTRSSAALPKKTVPSGIKSVKKVESKLKDATTSKAAPRTKSPESKCGNGAAISSASDTSLQTGAPSNSNHSPSGIALHRTTSTGSPAGRNSASADQYNRKAWQSRLANVRVELDHILKAPSRSAMKLVKILSMFSMSPTPSSGDWSTVPLDGRLEVLSAIRKNASQDFYDTWAHESKGLAMLEAWLKGAVQAQEKAKTTETLGGGNATDSEASQREALLIDILQTLAKLSLTVENLQNHAFAKFVLRINKEQNSSKFSTEVKRLSTFLEQKWRVMARVAKTGGSDSGVNSTADTKKRQEGVSEPLPNKKRKVETTRVPIVPTASSSKVANDLFGRPDKSKLPAFTKRVLEPAVPVVQDTFAEAMGLLKGRSASSMSTEATHLAANVSGKSGGKPVKRVRFVADNQLCQIRVVERLVYEGEEYETHPVGDARKMDHVEGRFLNSSDKFLEEEMEWETPLEVVLTSETVSNLETSPLTSAEAAAQEEREKSLVEVTYEDESSIPDTPTEPVDSEQSSGDTQSTGLPRLMKLGGDLLVDPEVSHLIAKVQADNSMNAPLATDHTVSDLLARLGRSGIAPSEVANQTTLSTNPSMLNLGFDINLLNSISQASSSQGLYPVSGNASTAPPLQPAGTMQVSDSLAAATRDNGWGAAAGSASRNREPRDASTPYIPTGPSAGVSRNKRRKKGKEGGQPRIPAHDSFGRHIKCKWWPNCPHGSKCFYKHG